MKIRRCLMYALPSVDHPRPPWAASFAWQELAYRSVGNRTCGPPLMTLCVTA